MALTRIDPSLLMGVRHADTQFIAHFAEACGWTLKRQPNGGIRMHADDGTEIMLPTNTGLNNRVFRAWTAKIWRHGSTRPDADTLADLMVVKVRLSPAHRRTVWGAVNLRPTGDDAPRERHANGRVMCARCKSRSIDSEIRGLCKVCIDEVDAPEAEPEADVVVLHAVEDEARYVVEQHPYRNMNGKGSAYGADVNPIIARKWSDGEVDYACSFPDCVKVAAKPQWVARHYASHVHGERVADGGQSTNHLVGDALPASEVAEANDVAGMVSASASAAVAVDAGGSVREHVVVSAPAVSPAPAPSSLVPEPTADDALRIVGAISDLIFPGLVERFQLLAAENERLRAERDDWERRAIEAECRAEQSEVRAARDESDMLALREMIVNLTTDRS